LEPLEFLLGVGTFSLAVKLKKPIRKAAVITASQFLNIVDRLKTTAYGFKEEIEDIVAEAQYENMKKNMEALEQSNVENDDNKKGDD
jgi:hypothetical protein